MRNRSPANKAASSPPVPARISRMTLRSSIASLGSSVTPQFLFERRAPRFELALFGFGDGAHFGVGRRIGDQALRSLRARAARRDRNLPPRPPARSRRIRVTASHRSRPARRRTDRVPAPHAGRPAHRVSVRAAWLRSVEDRAKLGSRYRRQISPSFARGWTRRSPFDQRAEELGGLAASRSSSMALTGPTADGVSDSER